MKTLFLTLAFVAGVCTVKAQTKQETLNYIKEVYSQINKTYVSGTNGTYYSEPQTLDSLKLEHDQLIFFIRIKSTKVIRAKISGEIKVDWDCLINVSGDKFMHVQEGNKAQLERLKKAVIHLQQFITKDPFDN